ncbi:MAG TPA: GGDEF domain-containing protein, partial [Burkholderiaceae bacterium]|nr:GGDEF domain-containing protein [Burkholderiaceae bacterium]
AHGHTAGDEVLRMFAEIVTAGVRADDVVARLGGEEFAVLLPNATLEKAAEVAERIRHAVAERALVLSCPAGARTLQITASIGAGALAEDADDAQRLLAAADTALYAAKRGGRNRVGRGEPASGSRYSTTDESAA